MPGEIADMMLNGDMCEACGVWLDGDGDGFPRYCSAQCRRDRMGPRCEPVRDTSRKPHICPHCTKRFRKEIGMKDHIRDVHVTPAKVST